jgi:hypothetical protein
MRVQISNASLFPEIDFASKCVGRGESSDMSEMLFPLSNAGSAGIRKRVAGKRFYLGSDKVNEVDEHVVLSLSPLPRLVQGERYV